MKNIFHITDPERYLLYSESLLSKIYPEKKTAHPDTLMPENMLTCIFAADEQEITGRIVLYPNTSNTNNESLLAGNYECINDSETARKLLNEGLSYAARLGYRSVTGPVNGNTWNNYRFITDSERSLFFSESDHPTYYPAQWKETGFVETAEYYSARQNDLNYDNKRLDEMLSAYSSLGIYVRTIDPSRFEEELTRVFPLCSRAFSANKFYSSISEKKFVSKFTPVKDLIDPSFVFLAEKNTEVCGFIFCIPNHNDKKEKGIIIKTLARDLQDVQCKGLGSLLSLLVTRQAAKKGFDYIIHAFMHNENNSAILSKRFNGTVIRKYALYEKLCS